MSSAELKPQFASLEFACRFMDINSGRPAYGLARNRLYSPKLASVQALHGSSLPIPHRTTRPSGDTCPLPSTASLARLIPPVVAYQPRTHDTLCPVVQHHNYRSPSSLLPNNDEKTSPVLTRPDRRYTLEHSERLMVIHTPTIQCRRPISRRTPTWQNNPTEAQLRICKLPLCGRIREIPPPPGNTPISI